MKNTLFKILPSAAFVAGLMLSASVLQAQELNKATLSTDPILPLGAFNDFEEIRWKDEVEAVL